MSNSSDKMQNLVSANVSKEKKTGDLVDVSSPAISIKNEAEASGVPGAREDAGIQDRNKGKDKVDKSKSESPTAMSSTGLYTEALEGMKSIEI